MKTINKICGLLILTVLLTGFTNCSDDDDNTIITDNEQTIAEFVADNPDYSMLQEALVRTQLDATLDAEGTFTVFAPDNSAFNAFLGGTAIADVPVATLQQILLNHVLGTTVFASDLTTGYITNLATYADTDANLNMYVNLEGSVPTINGGSAGTGADITATDIIFTNGVVHAVNSVIEIPTVVTFATADPTFDSLEAALTADPSFTFVSTLSGDGPFTVFAPTNAAFADLLAVLNITGLGEVDTQTLSAALAYHVIAGANVRSSDLSSGTVSTLGGDIIIDAAAGTITDPNGRVINIVVTDVQAGNGVVHAIDAVILPELPEIFQSIADFVASSDDYSLLLAALEYAELDGVLAGEGTFTVFAPNNAAFSAFLDGAALTDFSSAQVAQILLNHVLGSVETSGDLATGYLNNLATYADTDANLSMYFNLAGSVPQINGGSSATGGANITATDLQFNNGVVHAVDAVIALPTVVTFATADPTFSTLVSALTADASYTFVSTLQGDGPFTVFAPTNAAFGELLTDLGASSLDDVIAQIGVDGLASTLALHVISGTNVRAADLTSGTVTTLGGTVTIDATNATITDPAGGLSNIIVTDVQAANGVVHAIDAVLLPVF